ncbi:MAG: hypothetical protein KKB50_17570 [Planctomycetes bacterium]|nr:hypothetical protein [Planctomycetota bacterium]
MSPFWHSVNEPTLAQGDLLPACLIPTFDPGYGHGRDVEEVPVAEADLVVVTQSCDLKAQKVSLVALCPIYSLPEFEEANPKYAAKGMWEQVRKGRVEGLHLLASPTEPDSNRCALAVDFGQIFSLPLQYLMRHAEETGPRWRLDSPFLEHFSQAFARFFMRVGLPTSIPSFK